MLSCGYHFKSCTFLTFVYRGSIDAAEKVGEHKLSIIW